MKDAANLEDFRREVVAWLEANRPNQPEFLLPETFMEVGTDEQFEFLRSWQKKVYEAGYLGMAWPEEYGGGGRPQTYQDIVNAEMARLGVPFVPNTIGLNWAGPLILHMGTEDEKRDYIPGILSGDDIWCQGFSEPDHGSDLGNVQMRAARDGDEYILNGSKIWTSLGSYAKYMILLARTNPEASNKYAGLSYFLAPMQVEGVETSPIRKLTGEYGLRADLLSRRQDSVDLSHGRGGAGLADRHDHASVRAWGDRRPGGRSLFHVHRCRRRRRARPESDPRRPALDRGSAGA